MAGGGSGSFPGGKGRHGVYQRLINQIPPHRVYIETHLGGGAILRHKRPAALDVGVDRDPAVLRQWRGPAHVQLVQADAVSFLRSCRLAADDFVYADPPYVASTRRSKRPPYTHDYSDQDHRDLLSVLRQLPCMVMVSGYWSPIYAEGLAAWRSLRFSVRTRSGALAEEWVWMNYPEPRALHDYRYVGETFRDRERIRRRARRWRAMLAQLPPLERRALLAALIETAD